jgi:hypothetical protein
VAWTATAIGDGQAPVYQFRVGPLGGQLHVVRDFTPSSSFIWTPMQEGTYDIQVTVKSSFSAPGGESSDVAYSAASRVAGSVAVVSPTANPLVALYSAPPAPGGSMSVEFKPSNSNESWSTTAAQSIVPGESTNILVAGLLPNTTYQMRHVLADGTTSVPLTFTTGSLPANLKFPTFTVDKTPAPGTDLTQGIVFHVGLDAPPGTIGTVATDLNGQVVWYYDSVANAFPNYAPSLVPGGTVLLLGGKLLDQQGGATTLREVDLAGDTLRETNIDAVNAELAALGQHAITDFNHDAQRLPNGDTAVLATSPRTIVVNGKPVAYKGEQVIVLDQNFQVAWVWDPFQWLSTRRLPSLREGPSDWTHANSIAWSPADGNLIVSLRAQDWVIKIDYANGTGDGHVVWKLGTGGDFRLNATGPSPWFSHQHDVRYINNTTIVLFDNGNLRQSRQKSAHSRGQEFVLDEQARVATLVANVDLGTYVPYTGSAQVLPNGNLVFDSSLLEQTIEVLPDGTSTYVLGMHMQGLQYRSYMYGSLDGDPADFNLPSTPVPSRLARRLELLQHLAEGRRQRSARPHEIRPAHRPAAPLHLASPGPRA